MIRRFKNICLSAVTGLILFSCEHLQMENPSAVTDEFYNTQEGQEALLVDIYSKYRSVYNTAELQYYGTDLYMAITESPNERMFNGYDASFNSTAGVVGPYWSNLYKIVQEANILLSRSSSPSEGMTEEAFDRLQGQGHFLRTLAYYYLVETFGDVPLYSEENEDIIEESTRTSEEEIYQFMIGELTSAAPLLPWQSSSPGRANKAAVLYLLGKVHLTRAYKSFGEANDFQAAADYFNQIIDQGSDTYQLLDSYAAVYDENNQGNPEVIWSLQYGTDKNYVGGGNPQQALFGFNIVALHPDLFERVQRDYSAMNRQYWINPKAHELFTNPLLDSRYDVTFQREFYVNNPSSDQLGELGIYFPTWNDDSGNSKGAIHFYPFKVDGDYVWYPQSTALPVLNAGADRMPILRKFKDTQIQWGDPGSREDVAIRLSDVYLLNAEANLGTGNKALAIQLINSLRRRAAISPELRDQMEISYIDLDFILDERARELLGEHDRWFHLKRTGKLIERAKSYNIFVQKYDHINSQHLVRPIPQDELNKVKGLSQNPGY